MLSAGKCIQCKCVVWLPDELYNAAQRGRGKVQFFCGYGHSMVFAVGESENDKLRRERDRLAQQIAERDDRIRKSESVPRQRSAVHQPRAVRSRESRIAYRTVSARVAAGHLRTSPVT